MAASESPASITALIAARVQTLRGRTSGAVLAERLNGYGIPWNRTTVAKLENGRRESVTVAELLGLALALGTTPLSLISDPRSGSVPVAEGFDVDPWTVAQWVRGDGHNDERDPRLQVDRDTWVLFDLGNAIADLCRRVQHPAEIGQDHDARDRSLLRLLADHLDRAAKLGASPYPVPPAVSARAAELGVLLQPAGEG